MTFHMYINYFNFVRNPKIHFKLMNDGFGIVIVCEMSEGSLRGGGFLVVMKEEILSMYIGTLLECTWWVWADNKIR